MKHGVIVLLLSAPLCACATPYDRSEGLRATQAMTDMDGRPIDPGRSAGLGVGFSLGAWGRHGGVGIGIGPDW